MADRFDSFARSLSGMLSRRPTDPKQRPNPFEKTDDGKIVLKPPPFQVNGGRIPSKFGDPEQQPPPFHVNGTFADKGPPFTEPEPPDEEPESPS